MLPWLLMKLFPTVLALMALLVSGTTALTYTVDRCFCYDRHDVGFVNTYNLTLDSG